MRPEPAASIGSVARGHLEAMVESFCMRDDLSTADPYDVWNTRCGSVVKQFYYRHRLAGLAPAALLTTFDLYLNNERRAFYSRLEYPVVRAMAAVALLRCYKATKQQVYLDGARKHLVWLA